MFMELLPVLKDRMVTLKIARLDDQLLRVNVIPKRTSDKENKAAETVLSTPLTITGTAEELDREFAQQVRSYSGSYERAAATSVRSRSPTRRRSKPPRKKRKI